MKNQKKPWVVIAVDGVAASGKGTLSKQLAARFNFDYLDTGKLYRRLTLHLHRINRKKILVDEIENFKVFLNDPTVSAEDLQSEFISRNTYILAKQPWARKLLLQMQRDFANSFGKISKGAILDGRDIGTVVCPDADLKIFIEADIEVRASRRLKQLLDGGESTNFESVLNDLKGRDFSDSSRAISPMKPAGDAVVIDTSSLTIEAAFKLAESIVIDRLFY